MNLSADADSYLDRHPEMMDELSDAERDNLPAAMAVPSRDMLVPAPEREHVTDGSPCWCEPVTLAPDTTTWDSTLDPDICMPPPELDPNAQAQTQAPADVDGGSPVDPWDGAQFGNRVRAQGALREANRLGLADLADAIDRDRDDLTRDLYNKVVMLVEELGYGVRVYLGDPADTRTTKDVLDVDPFLDRLTSIFEAGPFFRAIDGLNRPNPDPDTEGL